MTAIGLGLAAGTTCRLHAAACASARPPQPRQQPPARVGLRGNAEGEAVWWAGRRRRVMRMRDVRVVQRHQMGYVEMVSVTQENLRICKRIRSAYSRTGTEVTGAAVRGDGEMDRRELEDAVVDAGSG